MSSESINDVSSRFKKNLETALQKIETLKKNGEEKNVKAAIEVFKKSSNDIAELKDLKQEVHISKEAHEEIHRIMEGIKFFVHTKVKYEKVAPAVVELFYRTLKDFEKDLDSLKRGKKVEKADFDPL